MRRAFDSRLYRRKSLASALLPVLLPLALSATTLHADSHEPTTVSGTAGNPAVNLWIKSAPLSLVVEQLGQLGSRNVQMQGDLSMPVSGRFTGDLEQALGELSRDLPVLFDLQQETLYATHRDQRSSVSVAVISDDLSQDFRQNLFEQISPGNDIEIRADSIRVTGHPDFVRRVTGIVTHQVAESDARTLSESSESILQLGAAESATLDGEDAMVGDSATAEEGMEPSLAVVDAGSEEMLADIADEGRPEADQATLSKPIRWVTDIPGFHTF